MEVLLWHYAPNRSSCLQPVLLRERDRITNLDYKILRIEANANGIWNIRIIGYDHVTYLL